MDEVRPDIHHIASCSFGKDSIAAILVRLKDKEPVDEVVYAELWFDENTPAEIPEHYHWIHEVAIPKLQEDYGLKTTIVRADLTYLDMFHKRVSRGENKGKKYGFPLRTAPWCNSDLKVRPLERYKRNLGETIDIIGYAYDELRRASRKLNDEKYVFPLIDRKITEAQAFAIAEEAGLLSPAYNNGRTRLGCWFCHNQGISELQRLRKEFPSYWNHLLSLEKLRVRKEFRADGKSLADLDHNFALDDKQLDLFGKEK